MRIICHLCRPRQPKSKCCVDIKQQVMDSSARRFDFVAISERKAETTADGSTCLLLHVSAWQHLSTHQFPGAASIRACQQQSGDKKMVHLPPCMMQSLAATSRSALPGGQQVTGAASSWTSSADTALDFCVVLLPSLDLCHGVHRITSGLGTASGLVSP